MSVIDGRPLSNTAGSVLDPIVSLRRRVRLEAGRKRAPRLLDARRRRRATPPWRSPTSIATRRPSTARPRWRGRRRRCSCTTSGSTPNEAHLFQDLAGRILYSDPTLRALRRRAEAQHVGGRGPLAIRDLRRSADRPVRIDEPEDRGHRPPAPPRARVLAHERPGGGPRHPQREGALLRRRSSRRPWRRWCGRASRRRGRTGPSRAAMSSSCDGISSRGGAARRPAGGGPGRPPEPPGDARRTARARPPRPRPRRSRAPPPARAEAPRTPPPRRRGPRVLQRPGRLRRRRARVRDGPRARGSGRRLRGSTSSPIPRSASRSRSRAPATPGRSTAGRTSSRPGPTIRSAIRRARRSTSATRTPARSGARPRCRSGRTPRPTSRGTARATAASSTTSHGIALDLLQFVPVEDPVKISRLTIENRSGRAAAALRHGLCRVGARRRRATRPRRSSSPRSTRPRGRSSRGTPGIRDFGDRVAFADLGGRPDRVDRRPHRVPGRERHARPSGRCSSAGDRSSGRVGAGLDPCAALQARSSSPPGGARRGRVPPRPGGDDRRGARARRPATATSISTSRFAGRTAQWDDIARRRAGQDARPLAWT